MLKKNIINYLLSLKNIIKNEISFIFIINMYIIKNIIDRYKNKYYT